MQSVPSTPSRHPLGLVAHVELSESLTPGYAVQSMESGGEFAGKEAAEEFVLERTGIPGRVTGRDRISLETSKGVDRVLLKLKCKGLRTNFDGERIIRMCAMRLKSDTSRSLKDLDFERKQLGGILRKRVTDSYAQESVAKKLKFQTSGSRGQGQNNTLILDGITNAGRAACRAVVEVTKFGGRCVLLTGTIAYRTRMEIFWTTHGPAAMSKYVLPAEFTRCGMYSRELDDVFRNRLLVRAVEAGVLPIGIKPLHFAVIFFSEGFEFAMSVEVREGEDGRATFFITDATDILVNLIEGTFAVTINGVRVEGELYERRITSSEMQTAIRRASESCQGIYHIVGSSCYSASGHILNYLDLLPQDRLRPIYLSLKLRVDELIFWFRHFYTVPLRLITLPIL